MKTRILVVDDSSFIRRVLTDWISSRPDWELAGVAANGQEGAAMAKSLKPDLITLDVEMPVMNGIDALREIMAHSPTRVVMVSSVTRKGAALTFRALELGAIDFFTKPGGSASIEFFAAKAELMAKLEGVLEARIQEAPARIRPAIRPVARPAAPAPEAPPERAARPAVPVRASGRVLVVASSTGGPKALSILFASLPAGFPAPIYIVQHMPAGFTESFAERLDRLGPVRVKIAEPGDLPAPGHAVLAPGGKHMRLTSQGRVELFDAPTRHGVRPAADYLFESAAQAFGGRCIAAVLTGMGRDGAEGALEIRKAGGEVVGESAESAVIYGMPKAAKEAGASQDEFTIDRMAEALTALASRRIKNAA